MRIPTAQNPVYCIIFDRAVKAVRTLDGGMDLLVYSPVKDEFEPATGLVDQFLCGEETDFVSEAEFEALVTRQLAEAKNRVKDVPAQRRR